MHVPEHFLDPGATAATAAVAVGGLAVASWRARAELSRNDLLFASVVTGFVFAAQMVNYSVPPGTSGHLMGGGLAAALLGPWRGALSVAVVLAVQSVFFADGGVSALGTNVLLISLVGVGCATAVMGTVRRATGRPRPLLEAGLGALASVPIAALVFCGLYLAGGAVPVPAGGLVASMLGVHALIGVGEAVVTIAVLALVMALAPGLAVRDERPLDAAARPRAVLGVAGAGVLCATALSLVASSAPDGLETVAVAYSFAGAAGPHPLSGSVLADYGEAAGLPVGLAGSIGLVLTAAAAGLLLAGLDRSRPPATAA